MGRDHKGQRGAILVLTAFLLPFIIAFTGMAVDFGNLYVQHQRLQNAADAAVLAGARAYADNNETTGSHPKADAMAREYILGKYHNLGTDEQINTPKYQAKEIDKNVYYHVDLSKEVPLYFLRFIKDTQTVSADSTASIKKAEQNDTPGYFNNLILFNQKLSFTNTINNPDKLTNDSYNKDSKNMISTTFDGRIAYNNSRTQFPIYSTQTGALDRLFTSKAKEYNETHNISDIIEGGDNMKASFNKDGSLISGYWTRAEKYDYDTDKFLAYMKTISADAPRVTDQNININNDQNKKQDFINNNIIVTPNSSQVIVVPRTPQIPNATISINASMDNTDAPLYIYIEKGMGQININVNADMNRPVIICIDGYKNIIDKNSQVNPAVSFNFQNHRFKGAIYAPYLRDISYDDNGQGAMIINASNGRFEGAIVAQSVNINGDKASFIYKDYTKDNSSSSSGGNSGSGVDKNSQIKLVASPSGVTWD